MFYVPPEGGHRPNGWGTHLCIPQALIAPLFCSKHLAECGQGMDMATNGTYIVFNTESFLNVRAVLWNRLLEKE